MTKTKYDIKDDVDSFAYEHGRPPSRKLQAAYRAKHDASGWHQGSGVHAGGTKALAEHHEAQIFEDPQRAGEHKQARDAWVKATQEEAKHLETTEGEFIGLRSWRKTPSGQATKEGKRLSRKLGVKPDEFF